MRTLSWRHRGLLLLLLATLAACSGGGDSSSAGAGGACVWDSSHWDNCNWG